MNFINIPDHRFRSYEKDRQSYKYLESSVDTFHRDLGLNSVIVSMSLDNNKFNLEESWKTILYLQSKFINITFLDPNMYYVLSSIERYHCKNNNIHKQYVIPLTDDNDKILEVWNNFIYRDEDLNLNINEDQSIICKRISIFNKLDNIYTKYQDISKEILLKTYDKLIKLSDKCTSDNDIINNYPHIHFVLFYKYQNSTDLYKNLYEIYNSYKLTRTKIDINNITKKYDDIPKINTPLNNITYILKDYTDKWLSSLLNLNQFKLYNVYNDVNIENYYNGFISSASKQINKIKINYIKPLNTSIKEKMIEEDDKLDFIIHIYGKGESIPDIIPTTIKPNVQKYTLNYYKCKILDFLEKEQLLFGSYKCNNSLCLFKKDKLSSYTWIPIEHRDTPEKIIDYIIYSDKFMTISDNDNRPNKWETYVKELVKMCKPDIVHQNFHTCIVDLSIIEFKDFFLHLSENGPIPDDNNKLYIDNKEIIQPCIVFLDKNQKYYPSFRYFPNFSKDEFIDGLNGFFHKWWFELFKYINAVNYCKFNEIGFNICKTLFEIIIQHEKSKLPLMRGNEIAQYLYQPIRSLYEFRVTNVNITPATVKSIMVNPSMWVRLSSDNAISFNNLPGSRIKTEKVDTTGFALLRKKEEMKQDNNHTTNSEPPPITIINNNGREVMNKESYKHTRNDEEFKQYTSSNITKYPNTYTHTNNVLSLNIVSVTSDKFKYPLDERLEDILDRDIPLILSNILGISKGNAYLDIPLNITKNYYPFICRERLKRGNIFSSLCQI